VNCSSLPTKNHYMMHGQQNIKENKETRYDEDGNINESGE